VNAKGVNRETKEPKLREKGNDQLKGEKAKKKVGRSNTTVPKVPEQKNYSRGQDSVEVKPESPLNRKACQGKKRKKKKRRREESRLREGRRPKHFSLTPEKKLFPRKRRNDGTQKNEKAKKKKQLGGGKEKQKPIHPVPKDKTSDGKNRRKRMRVKGQARVNKGKHQGLSGNETGWD